MKKATKFDFKTLLVLLLSFTLCFATVFAACNNANDSSSSSSSSSSTEETQYPSDTQLLKNGDFEYTTFTKKDTDFPVYGSSTNWTRGYASIGTSEAKSNSSKYPDGIIDTADDAYNAISDKNLPSENPRTPEYYGLVNSDDMYKVSEYENGEGKENEDKKLTSGTKILMIHNHTSNEGQGTARKYTSSSFTLARNQFAELSVWIKTVDLTANNAYGTLPGKDYGAYIALESTVSSSIAPVILKNIDTKGNWAKYTMYLSSSDFSTSSYKLVLGLGFGSATVTNEYVQGYAFFDNAHMEIIDRTEYLEKFGALETENKVNLYETDSKDLYKAVEGEIVIDQAGTTYTANDTTEEVKYTEVKYGVSHTRASSTIDDLFDSGIEAEKNKSDRAGEADFAGSNSLKGAYTATGLSDETKQLPGVNETEKSIVFNFSSAATGYSFTTNAITVKANSYMKLTFWMKAEAKNTYKNFLTATVRDLGKSTDHEAGSNVVETVLVSNDNTVDYENDNYNGWKQYVLFVSNTLGEVDRDFEIEFVFGTMDAIEKESDMRNLTKGFAIITAFEGYEMSAEDYAIADTSSYSYAKKVSLSADLPNGEAEDEDESESFSFDYSESEKKQLLTTGKTETVKDYQFVKADSNAVGGKNDNVYGYNSTEVNGGIVNSKYFDMGDLAKDKTVQAMYIEAASDSSVAYGFVGTEATLSASTTTYISVDVYASENAIANFYLASSNALNKFGIIKLNPNDEINKEFKQQYTGNSEYKWYTLAFLVTTGNESYSYRPEFWLGSRDGETLSNGTVYFNNYTVTTVDKDEKIAELTHMGLTEDTGKQAEYTRIDSIVKYNPVNGDADSNSSSGEKEVKETTKTYEPTVIYTEYNKNGMNVMVYDYSTYDVEHEIDMTTSDSTDDSSSSSSDSSTSADPTSFNWALQLTSIIIAAVLIVLLVVILIKTIVEKNSTKKSKSVEYYSRDSRAIAGEKALAKKAENEKKAAEDNDDDVVEEYDYNNPEINNNDKLSGENAAEEANETAEETTETEAEEGTETAENTEVTEGAAEATEESSTENNNGSDAE